MIDGPAAACSVPSAGVSALETTSEAAGSGLSDGRMPLLQACEGCHERKLRCSLTLQDTGPCERCIRHGRPCIRREEKKRGRPRAVNRGLYAHGMPAQHPSPWAYPAGMNPYMAPPAAYGGAHGAYPAMPHAMGYPAAHMPQPNMPPYPPQHHGTAQCGGAGWPPHPTGSPPSHAQASLSQFSPQARLLPAGFSPHHGAQQAAITADAILLHIRPRLFRTQLAASGDDDRLQRPLIVINTQLLDAPKHRQTFYEPAKGDMLLVALCRRGEREEELAAVAIRPGVGHREHAGPRVRHSERLVCKWKAVVHRAHAAGHDAAAGCTARQWRAISIRRPYQTSSKRCVYSMKRAKAANRPGRPANRQCSPTDIILGVCSPSA